MSCAVSSMKSDSFIPSRCRWTAHPQHRSRIIIVMRTAGVCWPTMPRTSISWTRQTRTSTRPPINPHGPIRHPSSTTRARQPCTTLASVAAATSPARQESIRKLTASTVRSDRAHHAPNTEGPGVVRGREKDPGVSRRGLFVELFVVEERLDVDRVGAVRGPGRRHPPRPADSASSSSRALLSRASSSWRTSA